MDIMVCGVLHWKIFVEDPHYNLVHRNLIKHIVLRCLLVVPDDRSASCSGTHRTCLLSQVCPSDASQFQIYLSTYLSIHPSIHACMPAYIHMHACMPACLHACMHTYIHTYRHTHTDIHTYIT